MKCCKFSIVLACILGAYKNNLECTLRNKVDKEEEEPVFQKKAGKAQSVSIFSVGHHVDRFDWLEKAALRPGSEELWEVVQCAGP